MNWEFYAEKWLLRLLLACPARIQQLTIGQPWTINDRRMDGQMQLLSTLARRKPSLNRLSVEDARKAVRNGIALFRRRPSNQITSHPLLIASGDTRVTMRVYQPSQVSQDAPAILYFHMGGFVVGDLDTNHDFCETLANVCGAKVYSVLYRKAPEYPYRDSFSDACIAHQWLLNNFNNEGIDPDKIVVAGDSAGGGLTAMLCQHLKQQGLPQPKLQLMLYPLTANGPYGDSWYQCQNCYPLTMPEAQWFVQQQYIANNDPNAELQAPMQSDDLTELAPAIMVTAGFDMLRDQGRAYGEQLAAAGVSVTQIECSGLSHGFTAVANGVRAAKQANLVIANTLRYQLNQ